MRQRDDINTQGSWLIGFSLFTTWGLGILGDWRGIGNALAATVDAASPVPAAQSTVLALLIVAFGLSYRRWERVAFSWGAMAIATLCGIAAVVLIDLSSPSAMLIAVAFFLQIVFKYLLFAWFRAFSRFDIEIILTYVPAILGAALALSGLLGLLPQYPRLGLAIAAALGQLVCLWRINATAPLSSKDGSSCPHRTLAVVLIASFAFCVFFRLIGLAAKQAEREPVLEVFCNVFYAEFGAGTALLGILVLIASFMSRKQAARSFTLLPFVLAGILFGMWLALCLAFPDCRDFSLRGLGQLSVDLLFVLFFLLLGKQLGCSSFQLFVLDEAVFTAAYLISAPLALALSFAGTSSLFRAMTTVLVLSAQSVVVFFFIMGHIILRNGLSDTLRIIAAALGGSQPLESGDKKQQDAAAAQSTPMKSVDEHNDTAPSANTAGESSGADAKAPEDSAVPKSRKSTIGSMASIYGLSERETEVMALLVKGRSMKRTAEELYLSLGTVNTYAKRIYAKLDIHTRQELIDRFDSLREKNAEP